MDPNDAGYEEGEQVLVSMEPAFQGLKQRDFDESSQSAAAMMTLVRDWEWVLSRPSVVWSPIDGSLVASHSRLLLF